MAVKTKSKTVVKKSDSKRRRVSSEDVRNNARESGGAKKYLNPPKGCGVWNGPEKEDESLLDIIGYEVKTETHPDRRGDKVIPGDIWWKFPYDVHGNIGPNKEEVVCPRTFKHPCPICEERERLAKNYKDNKEAIKAIKSKSQCLYALRDEKTGKFSIWGFSTYRFGETLDEELKRTDDDNLSFYVPSEGKSVKVRWTLKDFPDGRPFLMASRLDFVDRDPLDDDETYDAAPCLDTCLIELSYEALEKLFLQIPDNVATGKAKAAKKGTKPDPEPEEDEDEDDDTEDADETEAEDDDEEIDEDAESSAADPDFVTGATVTDAKGREGKIVKVGSKDDPNLITYDCAGRKLTADMADLTIVIGDDESEDEDAETEEDSEPDGAEEGSTSAAVGDRVQFTNSDGDLIVGKVIKIADNDDVTIKADDGTKHTVDIDDLTPEETGNDDDEEDEPEDDDELEDDIVPFKIGDRVTWGEDGDAGSITKTHSTGAKFKVLDDDGDEAWHAGVDLSPEPAKPKPAAKKAVKAVVKKR